MDELKKMLEDSGAPEAVKLAAIKLAFEIAVPLATSTTKTAAGGQFLAILMELLKMLLPILLELLKPKT